MSRDVSADLLTAVQSNKVIPIGMVALYYPSGTVRLWTGFRDLSWGGFTWQGIGSLGTIGQIEETLETRAVPVELQLSGIDGEVVRIAYNENWQGKEARVYIAALRTNGQFMGVPCLLRRGIMDTMKIVEGAESSITMTVESRDVDLRRRRTRRYTAQDQRNEHPGDAGCDGVADVQHWNGKWVG